MPRKNNRNVLNPFKILGLRSGASQSEVKRAYQKRLKQFHPDKGGNPAHLDLINRAYKQIVHDHFESNRERPVKASYYNPDQYQVPQLMDHRSFEINRFNNTFEENRNFDHNIYQVDPSQNVNRDRANYHRERGQVDHEIGQMKPVIDPHQRFNPQTFNQAFQEQVQNQANNQILDPQTGAVIDYQEPMASVSNLGPATASNSLVQYTEIEGGGSQGLSNLNFSGFEEGYQMNSPIAQTNQDPRMNGNVKKNYQDLIQARTRMDFQQSSGQNDYSPAINFQADDWNQSQVQNQINNQIPNYDPNNSVNINLVNQQGDSYPQSPEYNDNQPDQTPVNSQALVPRQASVPHHNQHEQLAQALIANEYQHKIQLQHLQQVYMQAQVQLMDNLSRLLKQHKMLQEQHNRNQPVQVVQTDNSSKVRKLEKEIKELKKTIAVQDKLLKSISLAQNAN